MVCGGRHHKDYEKVKDTLDMIPGIEIVIHGGARGADRLAATWAKRTEGITGICYPALWKDLSVRPVKILRNRFGEYNALAGPQRNQRMIDKEKPDLVIAFSGGRGTADMVKRSRKARITVMVVE